MSFFIWIWESARWFVDRDAYGFVLRPQHIQRYRECCNIYKVLNVEGCFRHPFIELENNLLLILFWFLGKNDKPEKTSSQFALLELGPSETREPRWNIQIFFFSCLLLSAILLCIKIWFDEAMFLALYSKRHFLVSFLSMYSGGGRGENG